MPYNPLSLKQQTLLYVVCNLEHFHYEHIKTLSKELRRKLILNLPVVDICQMEEQGITDDLTDDESSLWDDVSTRVPRHYGYEVERNIMFDSDLDDWKAYYFAVVLHVLFDRIKPERYRSHYELILHLLVGVNNPVDVCSWNGLQFSYFAPITSNRPLIPNRNLRYLTTRKSDIYFFSFIFDCCKYSPRCMCVVCDLFRESEIYKKHASDLLTKYFGTVEKMLFMFDYDKKAESFKSISKGKHLDLPYDVPAMMLKAALAAETPALRYIEFRDIDAEMLGETIRRAGPLFYAAYSSLSNIASKHIPYCQLKQIVLSLRGSKQVNSDTLQKLSSVVKHQHELEMVSLRCVSANSVDNNDRYLLFLSSFSQVIKRSHFKKCILNSMHIPVAGALTLIEALFSSPGQQLQKLTFDGVTLVGELSENEAPRKITMSSNSQKYKSLEFYSCELPPKFFQWIFNHPHVWLKRLAITNCKLPNSTGYYNSKTENVIHLAAVHSSIKISNLDLGNYVLIHDRHSASDFQKLFSSPCLEHLSIRAANLGYHGLIPDVTLGMKEQLEIGSLKNLSLIGNQIGEMPDDEIQALFNVIFSLPQIEYMTVKLSQNTFTKQHFTMMYSTWKILSGGKRFKQFSCNGCSFPHDTPFAEAFDKIAIKCYHW